MSLKLAIAVLGAAAVLSACGTAPGATTQPTTPGATSMPTAEATATAAAGEWPDRLVLGLVPSREADVLIESAKPLTDHLTQALSDRAGKTVTVRGFVPTDYTGLVTAMETDQADIGMFGPFSLLQARDRAGAEIVLQSVRFGSETYHSQWMTNNPETYCLDGEPVADEDGWLYCNGTLDADQGPVGEDAIALIEPGTTWAYVEPASTSGYIFPAVQLMQLAGIEDPIADLQATEAGGHDNAVLAVHRGDAEVGVSFDDARPGAFDDVVPEDPENVVVFAYSAEIPNDGVAVRGELPQEVKDGIVEALLEYADSEAGQEVLGEIYNIDDLVPADLEAFTVVEEAVNELGEIPEE